MKIIILIPVYNDYKSVSKLIEEINLNISNLKDKFSIILIDDASTDVPAVFSPKTDNVEDFKIIRMRKCGPGVQYRRLRKKRSLQEKIRKIKC